MALLDVEDLRLTLAGAPAPVLDGVSFAVAAGEAVGLVGGSGCGKTLTLLSLLGLPPPGARLAGSVRLDGEELVGAPAARLRAIRGRRIGLVFQEPLAALAPHLPVGAQIAEVARRHLGLTRAEAADRARELLRAVELADPDERMRRYPHQLSGGQRQRVAIAVALAGEPEFLLADEPTTALDTTVQASVLALLARLRRERGLGLVLVGHDLAVVASACETVAVMREGRTVARGPAAAIAGAGRERAEGAAAPDRRGEPGGPAEPGPGLPPGARGWLAPAAPPPGTCGALAPGETAPGSHGGLVPGGPAPGSRAALAPGKPAPEPRGALARRGPVPFAVEAAAGPPILEARDLAVHYRRRSGGREPVRAVDGVSLAIREREFVGLVGESGCGKTTLLRALARLVAPTAGTVLHRGEDLARRSGRALLPLRREVQPVFQDAHAALDPRQLVGDAVAEGLRIHGLARGPEIAARVEALLERCGLPAALAARYPHALSAGQRQRVGIARALAVGPRLLLADEPVASLDAPTRSRILDLFRSLREEGLGLLLASHDLAAVAAVADRVAVMYRGRLVELGPAAAVLGSPLHPYAAALVAAAPTPGRATAAVPLAPEPDERDRTGGCAFAPRCSRATGRCRHEDPALRPAGEERQVACHLAPSA